MQMDTDLASISLLAPLIQFWPQNDFDKVGNEHYE